MQLWVLLFPYNWPYRDVNYIANNNKIEIKGVLIIYDADNYVSIPFYKTDKLKRMGIFTTNNSPYVKQRLIIVKRAATCHIRNVSQYFEQPQNQKKIRFSKNVDAKHQYKLAIQELNKDIKNNALN